jgi:hypothetical protein
MRPSQILNLLSIPGTNNPVRFYPRSLAVDEPYDGWIANNDGNICGQLKKFQFDFVRWNHTAESVGESIDALEYAQPTVARRLSGANLDLSGKRLEWRGDTLETTDHLKGYGGPAKDNVLIITSDAKKIDVVFSAHGWSGYVEISVNNAIIQELDLFNMEIAVPRRFEYVNNTNETFELKMRPTGQKHRNALGIQMLIERVVEYTGEIENIVYKEKAGVNRGGSFRPRFMEIMKQLPSDAVVVDLGGGRRVFEDSRYINLDYAPLSEPHIIGDALALPFIDNCIDFIYTNAVLEHVENPLKMGQEIWRVLKPGGRVLANSAFMQPIHSEGQHFFNLTEYGIDLVFRQFKSRSVWCDVAFQYTINWIMQLANLQRKLPEDRYKAFLDIARECEGLIDPKDGRYFASGVWLEGIK